MEAQGKALIQRRAELEAAAQAQQQEVGNLRLEVTRLRRELQEWELEREVADIEEVPLSRSGMLSPTTALIRVRNKGRIFSKLETTNMMPKLLFCVTNPVLTSRAF